MSVLVPPKSPAQWPPTDPVALSLPVPFVFELFPKIRNYPIHDEYLKYKITTNSELQLQPDGQLNILTRVWSSGAHQTKLVQEGKN